MQRTGRIALAAVVVAFSACRGPTAKHDPDELKLGSDGDVRMFEKGFLDLGSISALNSRILDGTLIELGGCNSAVGSPNIAQAISKLLPKATVRGTAGKSVYVGNPSNPALSREYSPFGWMSYRNGEGKFIRPSRSDLAWGSATVAHPP